MEERRCGGCGEAFRPCPRVRDQTYCGKEECRRTRRRRWQRAKRQEDADYRDNQVRAQRAWSGEHRSYWRGDRSGNPQYEETQREGGEARPRGGGEGGGGAKQRQRDRRQRAGEKEQFAKMDSIGSFSSVPSGTYRLVPQMRKSLQSWTRYW